MEWEVLRVSVREGRREDREKWMTGRGCGGGSLRGREDKEEGSVIMEEVYGEDERTMESLCDERM